MCDLSSRVIVDEKRKKIEQLLSKKAHYDDLTNLPNRTLFSDRFSQAIAHSKRSNTSLCICFLDLDNFKPVNDTYGHDVGDQLLVEVAKRLKETIREEDTVSRQGGDEFTLLLSNIESKKQSQQLLARINSAMSEPYIIDHTTHKISASIGATLYPADDVDLDTLIRHADQAMYQAKLSGKNQQYFFSPENDQQIAQRQTQLQEIKQALTNNEFCLYYQPKVNMKTGKVYGAEALIRWIHPEKDLIPPIEFLPLIEGVALEIEIGNWVISEALQQLAQWHQLGIELEISINISSYHLQDENFLSHLENALNHYPSIQSQHLQLEILESSALSDLEIVSDIIDHCQTFLGISVALDDFGTGYSSLTHIRDLSADVIKIDRTFVRDLLVDPSDYSIIEGIIGLANAFNHKIIAEGVETNEHGLVLLIMGCNEAQGYGISRPLPAHDLVEWLMTYVHNPNWLRFEQQKLTTKQKKLILFQLTTKHWYINTLSSIKASLADSKMLKCHLGIWFDRLKSEKSFPKTWLMELQQQHNLMLNLANELSSSTKLDNSKLNDFNATYEQLQSLLNSQATYDLSLFQDNSGSA
ncbi:UNVERIFIED_CONTAM: hypothetical protein GTU68_066801 [Idotea baltica]|nr:hypothetical protein [Idotea baltica]